ncbi:MAG TPA: MFS transporter [Chthoniobacteraceae bacterium]
MAILLALSFSHLLNDTIQSLIPAIYPLLKESFSLNFSQIGLITLTFQLVASVLQPFVGFYTDRRPMPYSLAAGMGFTLIGLVLLSRAASYPAIVFSAGLIGVGSAIFHPESSRVARLASGGRHGFAQSLFQVGGNAGSALGPLLAALIIVPFGQSHILWFSFAAVAGVIILSNVGRWRKRHPDAVISGSRSAHHDPALAVPKRKVAFSLGILVALVFSKYFYLACLSSYYSFYLIGKFQLSVRSAQVYLFVFFAAVAAGTFIGGPVGDRLGRKRVIWVSILGVAPFALALPYANLFWTAALSVVIGLVLASAFSAILVYAQELAPGNVGMIAGLFFGLAFGMGGIGSAVLGKLADVTSISYVFQVCSYLPLIGLLTGFLPNIERAPQANA